MEYCLDSNVFIQAKNAHYHFSICPGFWDWLLTVRDKNLMMGQIRGLASFNFATATGCAVASTFLPHHQKFFDGNSEQASLKIFSFETVCCMDISIASLNWPESRAEFKNQTKSAYCPSLLKRSEKMSRTVLASPSGRNSRFH